MLYDNNCRWNALRNYREYIQQYLGPPVEAAMITSFTASGHELLDPATFLTISMTLSGSKGLDNIVLRAGIDASRNE